MNSHLVQFIFRDQEKNDQTQTPLNSNVFVWGVEVDLLFWSNPIQSLFDIVSLHNTLQLANNLIKQILDSIQNPTYIAIFVCYLLF